MKTCCRSLCAYSHKPGNSFLIARHGPWETSSSGDQMSRATDCGLFPVERAFVVSRSIFQLASPMDCPKKLRRSAMSIAAHAQRAPSKLRRSNSPRMVFTNYRELVRAADAEKWFCITPESV